MYLIGVDIFFEIVRNVSQSSLAERLTLLLEKVTKLQKKKIVNSGRMGEYHSRKDNIISKRKGSIRHNNRDFIADNVDRARIEWNRTYIKEDLTEAYEKCFGESLRAYNARQKRKDRQKGSISAK